MIDMTIRRGETLYIEIEADDVSAQTITLTVNDGNTLVLQETQNFTVSGGVATAIIDTDDTNYPEGEYTYMYTITYSDGLVDKLPDSDECDGDCDLPAFTICEANDDLGSS